MKSLAIPLTLPLAILCCACITQQKLQLRPIVLASEYYGPRNFTMVENDLLGDDETVFFYTEVTGFRTRKVDRHYEFWVSIDISLSDAAGNIYFEKKNEKEIHETNATKRPTYIYYKYPYYTGNLVLSGAYLVRIVATDKISGTLAETSKEFQVNLSLTRAED